MSNWNAHSFAIEVATYAKGMGRHDGTIYSADNIETSTFAAVLIEHTTKKCDFNEETACFVVRCRDYKGKKLKDIGESDATALFDDLKKIKQSYPK
jgi:hypothetical protein